MIIRDDVSKVLIGGKKALLINPPIYYTQYWAHWAQPHGLLKVAKWLKSSGYTDIRLIDCLATDEKRQVPYRTLGKVKRGDATKILRAYGMPLDDLRRQLICHS